MSQDNFVENAVGRKVPLEIDGKNIARSPVHSPVRRKKTNGAWVPVLAPSSIRGNNGTPITFTIIFFPICLNFV